jgi:hypothetical protein
MYALLCVYRYACIHVCKSIRAWIYVLYVHMSLIHSIHPLPQDYILSFIFAFTCEFLDEKNQDILLITTT